MSEMARVSRKPLQPNPFTTYRDPKTGSWIVVKSEPNELYVDKELESSQILNGEQGSDR